MGNQVLRAPSSAAVKQFSLFADNKVGRMHAAIKKLAEHDVFVLGLCTIDTTDSAIMRLVVNYWEEARECLKATGVSFCINDVLVAELGSVREIPMVTGALFQAEINIHYAYPLLVRPHGKCGLVLRLEDDEMAEAVLSQAGIETLRQNDLAR